MNQVFHNFLSGVSNSKVNVFKKDFWITCFKATLLFFPLATIPFSLIFLALTDYMKNPYLYYAAGETVLLFITFSTIALFLAFFGFYASIIESFQNKETTTSKGSNKGQERQAFTLFIDNKTGHEKQQ
ncbi:hypothetical protein [Bacillus pseudomycoides]|uniref:hypothetical protein n=1 Tax=Bacillus pseudomycoides TaxID=64104 RepID=UPI000BF22C2A|nr:hypothetical protein [Bacillus pseudomycoides]PEK34085.1 hypothetical protein CN691_12755 [Bacillus pseudomycoides]